MNFKSVYRKACSYTDVWDIYEIRESQLGEVTIKVAPHVHFEFSRFPL